MAAARFCASKSSFKKVRADNDKIRSLKEGGNVRDAERMAAEKKWDVMERRAQGEKVIDDAKVIKKKLRHLESKKKKSAKAWADRKATQKAAFRDRYDKRDANIEAKRKQRVNKRLKRKGINVPQEPGAKKSKRMRAGFEGRRSRSVN